MTYPKKQAEAQMIFRKTGGFVQGNMTLRDYFAAKAMQGFMEYATLKQTYAPPDDELARMSYQLADAMLKAREE